jgi:hypothetical protein
MEMHTNFWKSIQLEVSIDEIAENKQIRRKTIGTMTEFLAIAKETPAVYPDRKKWKRIAKRSWSSCRAAKKRY